MEKQNKAEIENADNSVSEAQVVVKKPEETCCQACYKQCTRDSIYQTLPGETWQQKDFRIRSVPDVYIEWNNDPPCPRGLLVCEYCHNLANCKQKRKFYDNKCLPICGECLDESRWRGWDEGEEGEGEGGEEERGEKETVR